MLVRNSAHSIRFYFPFPLAALEFMIRYILQTFFNPNYPDGSVSPRPKLRLYPYHSAGDHPEWRLAEEEEEEESLHGSLRTPPTESGDNKICMYCTHCSRRRMYTNARSSRDALQWEEDSDAKPSKSCRECFFCTTVGIWGFEALIFSRPRA